MCPEGVALFRALREVFPDAMWSGDWTRFDEVRDQLEEHLRHGDEEATAKPESA